MKQCQFMPITLSNRSLSSDSPTPLGQMVRIPFDTYIYIYIYIYMCVCVFVCVCVCLSIYTCLYFVYLFTWVGRGHAKGADLRYKVSYRMFAHWIFLIDNPSGLTMALGSTQPLKEKSTSNISWEVKSACSGGLTTLPPSCANSLEIWKPQPSGTLRYCPGLYWDCFTFHPMSAN